MTRVNIQNKSFAVISHAGCLLPLLIMLNLAFGWAFFKFIHWLLIELALIFLFVLNSVIFVKKLFSAAAGSSEVIDVEAKVVENKEQLN